MVAFDSRASAKLFSKSGRTHPAAPASRATDHPISLPTPSLTRTSPPPSFCTAHCRTRFVFAPSPCPPSATARCSHDDGLQYLQTAVSCHAESQWQWHRLCSRLVPPARKRHELPQIVSPSGNASQYAPLVPSSYATSMEDARAC